MCKFLGGRKDEITGCKSSGRLEMTSFEENR